jgi:MFS family permease
VIDASPRVEAGRDKATATAAAAASDHPRGFSALLVTQFFGAANDNVLKGVLAFAVAAGGVWSEALGPGGQGWVGLCLTVPFILFSGWGGQLADRLSKRSLTVGLKAVEVVVIAVAAWAFWIGEVWMAVAAMVLMATQSAFFGPAKYGMIPELVREQRLSGSNGVINLLTNLAIIAGTVAAGPIYDRYAPPPASIGAVASPLLPGAAMLLLAVLGFLASLPIPRLAAASPSLRFEWNPFGTYWESLRQMAKGPLIAVSLAWSFFYLLGMLVLLILPDYRDLLGISAEATAQLLGLVAISIGVGSLLAGVLSGKRIRPVLVPFGAAGMAASMLALGLAPREHALVGLLLLPLGLAAGFYIIPLQAMLQRLSPQAQRGRFLGTANAVSFLFSTLGSGVFLLCRRSGLEADRIFLVAAALALVAAVGVGAWWRLVGRSQVGDRLDAAAT